MGAWSSVQAGRCIRGATGVLTSTRLSERIALRGDHAQQLIPRGDEGRGALILQPHRKRVEIHAGPRELLQHYLRISAIGAQFVADFAVIRERLESLLGHRIHGQWRDQSFDVEDVGCLWILGTGASDVLYVE